MTWQRIFQSNPTAVVTRVAVYQVLAGAYAGRGRRGAAKQIDRVTHTHAVVVDDEGNYAVVDKTVCSRLVAADKLSDLEEPRGTPPTCPECLARVQRRGYLY